MVLHNQYPWDLAAGAARGGREDRRRRLRRRVRAAQPRGARVHPAREGRASRAARGPRRPPRRASRSRRSCPTVVREQFARHAPPRVAGGRQGRARLHERGHHPQRGLQLVADDRRRHRATRPGSRRAATRSAASSTSRCRRPTRRSRAPGARPEEIGAVIFCSCTSTTLIPSVATWLSGPARDLPDARLVRPRRRLRGLPLRPGRGGAPAPGGRAPGARRLRREVLGQDRQRPHRRG